MRLYNVVLVIALFVISILSRNGHAEEEVLSLKARIQQVLAEDEESGEEDDSFIDVHNTEVEESALLNLSLESDTATESTMRQEIMSRLQATHGVADAFSETDKAKCCIAAFNLCEPPPGLLSAQFKKTRQRFLLHARKQCVPVWTVKLKTEKQICAFYADTRNCPYYGTAEGVDLYVEHLPDCCARAVESCATGNNSSFYLAKRECIGYIFRERTQEAVCEQSKLKECAIPKKK